MVTKTAVPAWPMPRIGSKRHPKRSTLGPILAAVGKLMDVDLYGWQRHLSDVSTELVARKGPGTRKRLAAGNVGVLASRQSGKTLWIAARVALQCLAPELPQVADLVGAGDVPIKAQHVAITGQDRVAALIRWYEHVDMIMASPLAAAVRKVVRKNGEECVHWTNGSTYRVLTPSKTGARGQHLDLVVVDEALAHESWLAAVLRPTMAQRDTAIGCLGAQFLLISNAGDQRSTLLNEQRELGRRAVATDDQRRVWLEWSCSDSDDAYDENVWRRTIPTLDQPDGISVDFIRNEAESLSLEDFAREYLCRYTPRRDAFVIDPTRWHELAPWTPGGDVVLALDASRDRDMASVVAAGWAEDLIAIELIEQRAGSVDWIAEFTIGVALRQNAAVIVDQYGPLSGVIPVLERAGIDVVPVRVGEVVAAAQGFVDAINSGRLAHLPDPRFPVEAVGRRLVGERWCFSRTGEADISPIIAASLACWGVATDLLGSPTIH